jgi:hypothetical protein
VNHLYFYPKKADLANVALAKSARNIALEVKLLDNDDNIAQPGMKAIYGDCTTPAMLTSAFTAVNYHASKPRFIDEVKINLPLHVTEKHHLLITFHHVSCKPGKGKTEDATVRTPLCDYALLPPALTYCAQFRHPSPTRTSRFFRMASSFPGLLA